MASADLKDNLTCCICTDIYTDPVTLTCGHSFCRLCITKTWENQEAGEYSCPGCRQRFRVKAELKRNLTLCNIVDSFNHSNEPVQKKVEIPCTYCDSPVPAVKTCLLCEASLCDKHLKKHSKSEEHVLTEPTTSLENRKCSVHKKVLEYYCCVEATCICVSCRLDGEHRGHQVETLNEALEKKLRHFLEKLTSQREEAEKRVQSLEELRRQVQGKAAGVTESVTNMIRDIRKQLEVLEERVLSEISRQEEQVSLRVSDLIRQLEIKKEELSRKMGDIEELCNMKDPLTVLQGWESDRDDYCDTEDRDEIVSRDDVVGLDVEWISVILQSVLSNIVDTTMSQRHLLEAFLGVKVATDILLDINTAGDNLAISDDLKYMSLSKQSLSRPDTEERFAFSQVLSSNSFSSGQHYWEVKVGKSGEWSIGMSYPSIARRGPRSMNGDNDKSWILWKWDNENYKASHNSQMTRIPYCASFPRLGIFLNYEAGRLSFYELCDPIRHLHTFTAAFTEPLHAVFWLFYKSDLHGQENCHLRII